MVNHNRTVSEGTSSDIGIGGAYACDRKECGHFSTSDYSKFADHCLGHPVKSGSAKCKECGKDIEFKFSAIKPTNADVKDRLVFHDKCEKKFYERRGLTKHV